MSLDLYRMFITQSATLSSVTLRIRTITSMDDDWKITSNNAILSDPQEIGAGRMRDMTFSNVPVGNQIHLYLYDGAPSFFDFYKWEATITWPDTTQTVLTGGSTYGNSTTAAPAYFNNGCFTIAKTQPYQPWPYTTAYQLITSANIAERLNDYSQWDIVWDNVGSIPLSADKKISKGCFRFVMYNVYDNTYQVLGNDKVVTTSLPNSGYFELAKPFLDYAPMVDCSFKIIAFKFYGQTWTNSSFGSGGFVGSTDYYKAFVKRF